MAAVDEIAEDGQQQVHADSMSSNASNFCLKALVGDDIYEQLKCSFLPKGKGRPQDPPQVILTNHLLLQLVLLKAEGNKTGKQVATWFQRLFPDVCYPSSRLSGALNRLMKKVKNMHEKGADLSTFLLTTVDFDFISTTLSDMGLERGQLMGKREFLKGQQRKTLTNEAVVDLENFRTGEGLSDKFTIQWIRTLSGSNKCDQVLKKSMKKLMSSYTTLRDKRGGNAERMSAFLAATFVVLPETEASTSKKSEEDSTEKVLLKFSKEKLKLLEQISALETENNILTETVQDLNRDKMVQATQISENQRLTADVRKLKVVVAEQKQKLLDMKPEKLRHLKRAIVKLRAKVNETKAKGNRYSQLKKEHRILKQTMARQQQSQLRAMRRANMRLKLLKREQEVEQDAFQSQAENVLENLRPVVRCENNRFTDQMRKTVMHLQSNGNVSAGKCGEVIKVVADQLFGVNFTDQDLPCLQTAINIADEGHVLSKMQTAEKMLETDNFTIHCDGTSRGGKKIVGHQITLDNGDTLSLGFSIVASEDATSLLDLITQLLREIIDLYCDGREDDTDHTFQTLLSKMTSVMTDRAAVMKSMDAKLLSFLKSELGQTSTLHFLHCNAHFLLGMSHSCESALKKKEEELVNTVGMLGRDSLPKFQRFHKTETATSRVIRLTSDIAGPRGDEKNGCRAEWIAYCAEIGVMSHMTNYRSNRFNCFFQAAAAIIYHHAQLQEFFTGGYLSHTNLKIESVAADLKDESLLALVCAIALMFLRVSGPFFQLVQSTVKYVDFHIYIQKMEACFDRWRDDASDLLNPGFDGLFSGEFELDSDMADAVYQYATQHSTAVQAGLEYIMREVLLVTRRQLKDFLHEGKFGIELPAHVQEELKHCPLTNLMGENVFGEMDFDMKKNRNSSFHHRTSTQIMKHNKTPGWLNSKDTNEAHQLLFTARRRAKQLRKQHKQQERLVLQKVQDMLRQNEQVKRLKTAQAAERQATLIRRVVAQGGPCKCPADVTRLLTKLGQERSGKGKIGSALRDEIRYQKQILKKGGNLRVAGTVDDLEEALKNHFRGDCEMPASPQHQQPFNDSSASSSSEEESTRKRQCFEPDGREEDVDAVPFVFSNQGEWIAVYYDEQFYVGQVVEVHSQKEATVQYLTKTKGRYDYFRWPEVEDIAKTSIEFVFRSRFDVVPISSDGRVWKVSSVDEISEAYNRIKAHTLTLSE